MLGLIYFIAMRHVTTTGLMYGHRHGGSNVAERVLSGQWSLDVDAGRMIPSIATPIRFVACSSIVYPSSLGTLSCCTIMFLQIEPRCFMSTISLL